MNSNKYLIYRAFFLIFCLSWFSMTTMADEENVTTLKNGLVAVMLVMLPLFRL